MRYCCVKCGKSHDEKSHICKECSENLVMPYTQEWWEKIIKEKDKQNKSLQTKLQQAKDRAYRCLMYLSEKGEYQYLGLSEAVDLIEKEIKETLEEINKE